MGVIKIEYKINIAIMLLNCEIPGYKIISCIKENMTNKPVYNIEYRCENCKTIFNTKLAVDKSAVFVCGNCKGLKTRECIHGKYMIIPNSEFGETEIIGFKVLSEYYYRKASKQAKYLGIKEKANVYRYIYSNNKF